MYKLFLFAISLFMYPYIAQAQCINTEKPSCGVYENCFEKYCKCFSSSDEYFISFGKKYCEAFLSEEAFSDEGKKWKEKTLRCLQEKIVPLIPIENPGTCNCADVKTFAVSTHVECYTQTGTSICDLPLADITLIAKTIIYNNSFINLLKEREAAYSQVEGVFEKCSSTTQKEENKNRWKFLYKALKGKIIN